MQILITHTHSPRTLVLRLSRLQITAAALTLVMLLLLLSGATYHFIFLKAARDGWPVVSQIVGLVVRDEIAQRDRFMRENLDAMANKLGEMQAKMIKLDSVSERVLGLAGVKADDIKGIKRAGDGKGGPFVPLDRPSLAQLDQAVGALDESADRHSDVFTLVESRLFERRMQALMVPTTAPVEGPVGSGFGFRADPFTGRAALHTGLDFPAEAGTDVRAAAGGLVLSAETHANYGLMLEVDHGNGLVTRYAHLSKASVGAGDLVKRGQVVGQVGNSGRSTGPHLHFEVMVDAVTQDPAKFLASGRDAALATHKSARR